MRILAKICLLLLCVVALALPHLADAKAGGGRSMGSMGSHTYNSSPMAAPIQRSVTPPPIVTPSYNRGYTNPGYAPSFGTSHPFLTGLAGGFLGAGLAGMLFGHGWGDSMGGLSGGGMGILPLLLLAAAGYFIFRAMRNRSGGASGFGGMGGFPPMGSGYDASFNAAPMAAAPAMMEAPLTPTQEDYQSFMQSLEKIQLAWGGADMNHLRQYVTPEMLGYFSEELSANVSRGVINMISNVTVNEGALVQAWSEQDLDYATVHLKWNAVDYMARADRAPGDADYVVSGDATHPVPAEEIWTFARARDGGHWLLSAIQQVTPRIGAA
jgi:predicted lipid-binding transport protein (Tim44 family)